MQGTNPNFSNHSKSITRSLSKTYGCKKGQCRTRSIIWNQEIQNPDRCVNDGPDIYRSVLGPTTDETILAGLQTIMDMCRSPWKSDSQPPNLSIASSGGECSSTRILDAHQAADQDVANWLQTELYSAVDNEIQKDCKMPSVNEQEMIEDIKDFWKAKNAADDYIVRSRSRGSFTSQPARNKLVIDKSASAIALPNPSKSYMVRKCCSCRSVQANSEPVQAKKLSSVRTGSSTIKRPCQCLASLPSSRSSAQQQCSSSTSSCDETVKTTITQTVNDKSTSFQIKKEECKKKDRVCSNELCNTSVCENRLPKGSKYKCSPDCSRVSSAVISKSKCCSCQTATHANATDKRNVVDPFYWEHDKSSLGSEQTSLEGDAKPSPKPTRSIISNCPKPTQSSIKPAKTLSTLPEEKADMYYDRTTSVSGNVLARELSKSVAQSERVLPSATSYHPTEASEESLSEKVASRPQPTLSQVGSRKSVTLPQASRAVEDPAEGVFFLPPTSGVFSTKGASFVAPRVEEKSTSDVRSGLLRSSKPAIQSRTQNEPIDQSVASKSATNMTQRCCKCLERQTVPDERSTLLTSSKPRFPSRIQSEFSNQIPPPKSATSMSHRSSHAEEEQISPNQNKSFSVPSKPILSSVRKESVMQPPPPSRTIQQPSYRAIEPPAKPVLTCLCANEPYYDIEDPLCEPEQCSDLHADCLQDPKLCIRQVQAVPNEVRYAIVRISRFPDYATYEIMKSTRAKPRVIPKTVEGIFVLKNNKLR